MIYDIKKKDDFDIKIYLNKSAKYIKKIEKLEKTKNKKYKISINNFFKLFYSIKKDKNSSLKKNEILRNKKNLNSDWTKRSTPPDLLTYGQEIQLIDEDKFIKIKKNFRKISRIGKRS